MFGYTRLLRGLIDFLHLAIVLCASVASAAGEVVLTAAERDFLAAHPRIEFGTDADWEPFVIVDALGGVTGYDADILARINALTGADIRLVPGRWAQMVERADRRDIDGLSTSAVHPERRSRFSFSNVYNEMRYVVMVPKGNPLGLKTRADLDGRSIAMQRGNIALQKLALGFQQSRIVQLESPDAIIQALASGQVDASFDNGALLLYRASRIGAPYLQQAFVLDESLELVFSVRDDWPELVSILNKGLAAIGAQEREHLQARWFMAPTPAKTLSVKEQLTGEERDFLEALGPLRLCVDPDWMPMDGVTPDGRHQGILADLMEVLGRRLGASLQRIPTANWDASLSAMRAGLCDLLVGAAITPARQEYLAFTPPLLSEPLVVVTSRDGDFDGSLENYRKEQFVTVRGHASGELLGRAYPAISMGEVADVVTGLRAVQSGEVFGYIDLLPTVAHAAQAYGILGVKIAGDLPQRYELAIAVRRDNPLLHSILSKAVASLSPAEIKAVRDHWTSVRYEQSRDYRWLWPYVIGGLLALALVMGWNRRLARLNASLGEANARIAEISITDALTGIPNRRHFNEVVPREWRRALREGTPINLMLIDVDHFKQYNDSAGHQAGDQVLARVAAVLREHSRRAGDFCFRIGGEEFALLTRTLNHEDAKPLAEALRAACEGLAIPHPGRPSGSVVTVSIGALWAQPVVPGSDRSTIPDDWNALYRRADALLYAAKEQGRNRVVADLWTPTVACDPEAI